VRRIQAVVFDLDDTLYPERAYAFSGFDAVAGAFENVLGDPQVSARRMKALFDTSHRRRVFDQLLEESNPACADTALVEKMVDTFRDHAPDITLPSESVRVLAELSASFRLGLITDGPAATQRAKIKVLGLVERSTVSDSSSPCRCSDPPGQSKEKAGVVFDAMIVTDELGPGFGKPNPRAFELIAAKLAVTPDACVYVADNPEKDFVAPNRLGWLTVRVVRPDGVYANARSAKDGDPHETINGLDALPALLKPGEV